MKIHLLIGFLGSGKTTAIQHAVLGLLHEGEILLLQQGGELRKVSEFQIITRNSTVNSSRIVVRNNTPTVHTGAQKQLNDGKNEDP